MQKSRWPPTRDFSTTWAARTVWAAVLSAATFTTASATARAAQRPTMTTFRSCSSGFRWLWSLREFGALRASFLMLCCCSSQACSFRTCCHSMMSSCTSRWEELCNFNNSHKTSSYEAKITILLASFILSTCLLYTYTVLVVRKCDLCMYICQFKFTCIKDAKLQHMICSAANNYYLTRS